MRSIGDHSLLPVVINQKAGLLTHMSHSFKQILATLEFIAGVGGAYEIIVMQYGLWIILCS